MKTCKTCKKTLPLSAFHKDRNLKDGYRNICKQCACQRSRKSWRDKLDATNGLLDVLHSMKHRCYNPRHNSYSRYGGRGIEICEEWLFDENQFYQWAINNGYEKGLQIDRIDNSKGYAPENCRFVTPAQNQHNTDRCVLSDDDIRCIRNLHSNRRKSQRQIAKFFGVSQSVISRICSGKTWKEESLCVTP
ncbi:MAG: helix-turn-helix domain-containing protein [Pirellulales bacterium]|nr:helix-turn-helix domain-containing protein [Pirellulales bacterium]